MGGTARGAGRSGAQHAMAVNETVVAFVLGGSASGAAGGVGTVRSRSTETEFLLPGGKPQVRPDGVWQAPEIGVSVLMVEVDRFTMAPAARSYARVASARRRSRSLSAQVFGPIVAYRLAICAIASSRPGGGGLVGLV
ncbi:hypothetical protein [Kitasatospora sp. NPDC059327]|uniref:hypothetical protein n=1 Tax=Kitasatospora sp. NPDC059327 TaxID=3346803 RepID=UPI00367EE240